jgi:hypothetical protein
LLWACAWPPRAKPRPPHPIHYSLDRTMPTKGQQSTILRYILYTGICTYQYVAWMFERANKRSLGASPM